LKKKYFIKKSEINYKCYFLKNGQKWPKMIKNGQKMAKNDQKWPKNQNFKKSLW